VVKEEEEEKKKKMMKKKKKKSRSLHFLPVLFVHIKVSRSFYHARRLYNLNGYTLSLVNLSCLDD
jgi:hypothetical protein